jgi:uncharacterized SAM-binding protein YcdF (DUF218 family)
MELITAKTLGLLLLPPGVLVLLALVGLVIQARWRWIGISLIGLSIGALFVLSTAHTGRQLLVTLEAPYKALPVLTPDQARAQAEAIVVIGGGLYSAAPEYGGNTVNRFSLERVRYAAHLQRQTNLPILVSGGAVFGEGRGEAESMREVLVRELGATVKWIEARSNNTYENAVNSKQILSEAGIRRVYLVTHAWHMSRAEWAFVQSGTLVTPAPMGFTTPSSEDYRQLGYLPSSRGLYLSSLGLHERLGLFWYKSKYQAEQVFPVKEKKPAVTD